VSTVAVTLVTYVWHYVVARLIYDQLLRPVVHGHLSALLVLACILAGVLLLARRWGRRA
jgi:hypothetical protein